LTVSHTADLLLMRASLLLESDPAAAARSASEILTGHPGHPEASLLLAAAARRLGNSKDAATVLESLAPAHRDTPFMQLELGRAYVGSGRTESAIAAFRHAIALDPGLADAWRELATQLFAAGDIHGGDAAYGHYSRLVPDPQELKDATVAFSENRLEAAEGLLKRRLQQAPHDVIALRMLAEIATRLENFAEAEARLSTCLALAPGYAQARFDLANLLHLQHRDLEVLPLVERLLACEPGNIDFLSLEAHAMRLLGRIPEAIALMEETVASHPDEERAWLLCGHLLREAGQQARAIEMYRRAIELRPQYGHPYSSLANLKTFRFTSTDVTAMQEQLAGSSLRSADRTHFEFALGKALEDEGQFAASFEHYARGNSLQRAVVGHDADATAADVRRAKALFTPGFFADRSGWGSSSAEPIFIVGLPRSGSTLLEQMLASHSQVEGTRELMYVPALALETQSRPNQTGPHTYPESLATLGRQDYAALAARYLSRTQVHRPLARPRFVDKMLANFCHIGLIHLMFPGAAIIDARRHPLGCGFSCYKQQFARGFGFTYDLADMGRYYRDYADLLEHFDTVLPGRVHRVHYEQLVANPEGELRKLLDYCGLPFEAQCLQFHENRRVVQTISSEQVRRPIYTESVHHWRNYEPWLGPMQAALGDLADRYPGPQTAAR
jgi:tetratricopeptide (TPR) repeat protein